MNREIDLLTADDIIDFHPNYKQMSLKVMLLERTSPGFLGKVTEETLAVIEPYIAPFKMRDIAMWMKQPGFFEWLLTPEAFILDIHAAKQRAVGVVTEMLELDPTDETLNTKVLGVKLKAAELLLKSEQRKEQRVQQTLKITNNIPKHLASKSVEALEEDLRKLKGS